MVWLLLYVVLSFPAVWVMGKLESPLVTDPEQRFTSAMFWPVFLFLMLIYQLGTIWDSIYLKMFPGDKENTG